MEYFELFLIWCVSLWFFTLCFRVIDWFVLKLFETIEALKLYVSIEVGLKEQQRLLKKNEEHIARINALRMQTAYEQYMQKEREKNQKEKDDLILKLMKNYVDKFVKKE